MPFTDLEPVDRRATATIIAETIRERIMDGSFEPGVQLTEVQLAGRLGVSRGPVREAFQRLVQEGLLTAEPHRGVFVTSLDAEDASDVALARSTVERAAAALVARAGDPDVLARLTAIVDEMGAAAEGGGWAGLAEADLRFHEALVDGAGSPRLTRMYATLLAETRLCLRAVPGEDPEPGQVLAEHRSMLDALRSGDAQEAAALVGDHVRGTAPT